MAKSLPRSLDVAISVSKAQAEIRTDLSVMCIAAEDLGWGSRLKVFSSIEAVEAYVPTTHTAYKAAEAFFSQTPRPSRMVIGEVKFDAQPAYLQGVPMSTAELAAAVANQNNSGIHIVLNDVEHYADGIDARTATTVAELATIISGRLAATSPGIFAVTAVAVGSKYALRIASVATGSTQKIGYATASGTTLDLLPNLGLTSAEVGGEICAGRDASNISAELSELQKAANNMGIFIYGWALASTLREISIQTDAAAWVLARTGFMTLVTNSLEALDPETASDLGSILNAAGNRRVKAIYHDDATAYPDVSILAYMLHVNYKLSDSTVTGKFKELPGVPTVNIDETQLAALLAKGYDTYTSVGNSTRTYRDGKTNSDSWFMDSVINIDNFVEDLSVNVYNVFVRNKKVPYTRAGQMLIVDACRDTGRQYVYNGAFADREETDITSKSGIKILPAVDVIPTPIQNATVADRASRIAPPIQLIVQEAGAMHSVAIAVEVVS